MFVSTSLPTQSCSSSFYAFVAASRRHRRPRPQWSVAVAHRCSPSISQCLWRTADTVADASCQYVRRAVIVSTSPSRNHVVAAVITLEHRRSIGGRYAWRRHPRCASPPLRCRYSSVQVPVPVVNLTVTCRAVRRHHRRLDVRSTRELSVIVVGVATTQSLAAITSTSAVVQDVARYAESRR